MPEMVTSLGICLGASTVSVVQIGSRANPTSKEIETPKILDVSLYPHGGNPRKTLRKALAAIDLSTIDRIAATGRKFRHFLNLTTLAEPEAVELAYQYVKPPDVNCPAVISAGGETFMVYQLSPEGQITNVLTGNKCAAGTGEFFLQQLRRLNASLEEAAQWAAETDPYPVSGRCSVFCKSDCTHATNKGIPKAQVASGLGRMMANKIIELLKKVQRRNLMLTGGTTRNQMMVRFLQDAVPGLVIPEQAPYFEALGAALWALKHPTAPFPGRDSLFLDNQSSFDVLPPLSDYRPMVEFKSMRQDRIQAGDVCILGLDVGSTTTKAVLMRRYDNALLASIYLRTNGDPVNAARHCYSAIVDQIGRHVDPDGVEIVGLGVCGSGRQIAGLHALTHGVVNEIIAHATAAVYFDTQVDTIFEIGGQDAKYTYITNGVPSDYAMNEACSAGTGSFLEESALESLGIAMEKIADVALSGQAPPNFNDQCAAFIASDIKNAIHEGLAHEDIAAGLVYSICMNYNNRVKGNRPVGNKVFMQGGVCYNAAVPLAMAALTGKPIIVPPEPGLMGAFGAALEVKKRLANGIMSADRFHLPTLARRKVVYGPSFVCKGGKDKCDRGCEIARIVIDEQTYPFGGACNRYENLRRKRRIDTAGLDLVRVRQELIFGKYAPPALTPHDQGYRGRVGINRSFLVNTYYPLYANFFSALGFDPILPGSADQTGIDQRNAPFCFPGELAHGFFHRLINATDPPEFIFLPYFKSVPALDGVRQSQACPLVQGETFYLQTTFRHQLQQLREKGVRILSPMLELSKGVHMAAQPLIAMARQMGVSRRAATMAFERALTSMEACRNEMLAIGREALQKLERDPVQIGVVLLARPYNGYVSEAHMGIPHKFASRGVMALPLDFLDIAGQPSKRYMYWGMGQGIMMAARFVKSHPQLYGTYITNFSCGPDSFIVGYFRDIMVRKPSLTLELDSHSADAGLETRIEAFLDIVQAHRQLEKNQDTAIPVTKGFQPARTTLHKKAAGVVTSDGHTLSLDDPRVTLLIPSMGALGTQALAAAFRSSGIKALAHEPSNEAILKLGRGHTSCKECLPLILTTGTLLNYLRERKTSGEVVVYFMPNGSGPCRFGQYHIFMQDLISKLGIRDVAIFSLSSDYGYDGLGMDIHRRGWWAVVVSDVFEDIRAMLLANAQEPKQAMALFEREFETVLAALKTGQRRPLHDTLQQVAMRFRKIPLKRPVADVPTILLNGEIFVRRDALSRQYLTEYLAAKGFATVCAPVAEWILYSDFVINEGFTKSTYKGVQGKLKSRIKQQVMRRDERQIKKILIASGLVNAQPVRIAPIIEAARPFISPYLGGEAILTVGSSLAEVVSHACGVIAIGPFGCMPNRLSEAILKETMTRADKLASDPHNKYLKTALSDQINLPFLAIESDGSPFPQLIYAKLEAFCLQAERLHRCITC